MYIIRYVYKFCNTEGGKIKNYLYICHRICIANNLITSFMKKFFFLLVFLHCCVGQGMAQTLIDGIYYNLDSESGTAEVSSGWPKYSGDITIPASVTYLGTSYSVTSIGNWAFSGCSGLTSITIPNSVTSIGYAAFGSCVGLTSITIPNSVTNIGDHAFSGCSGLISVTIPNSVTSIGDSAFQSCSKLTSVTIGNSVTNIGERAFAYCSSLTSITIPNSVTSIDDWAFSDCSGLTSVTIPNSVTSIGDSAFQSCSKLTSVTIGNSVTSIGERAFSFCSGLTSIVVDAENTHYDSRYSCNAIVETASNTLIAGCKNTMIPNSVTSIGDLAFAGCKDLAYTEIPNYVTSIGNSAFYGCSGLISMTIPNTVTSIGNSAFSGCSGLTSIVVDAKNTHYDSRNNCNAIIETSNNKLIAGCLNTVIPNSVTCIGDGSFAYCSSLTSITIPNSVTSIEDWAFSDCSGLTSITIPNSVTSIGYGAFVRCSGLTSITIPNSVTSIEHIAFGYLSSLTNIKMMSATPPTTVNSPFDSCTSLTTVYVPKGAKEAYNIRPWNEYEIVEFEDTGIADAPTIANSHANAPVYDLNGRRVGTADEISGLPKGAYIVNGTKIIR